MIWHDQAGARHGGSTRRPGRPCAREPVAPQLRHRELRRDPHRGDAAPGPPLRLGFPQAAEPRAVLRREVGASLHALPRARDAVHGGARAAGDGARPAAARACRRARRRARRAAPGAAGDPQGGRRDADHLDGLLAADGSAVSARQGPRDGGRADAVRARGSRPRARRDGRNSGDLWARRSGRGRRRALLRHQHGDAGALDRRRMPPLPAAARPTHPGTGTARAVQRAPRLRRGDSLRRVRRLPDGRAELGHGAGQPVSEGGAPPHRTRRHRWSARKARDREPAAVGGRGSRQAGDRRDGQPVPRTRPGLLDQSGHLGRRDGCRHGGDPLMDYTFLVDTYASERFKTLSVWSMFADADLDVRPHPNLARDRTCREHMVHQCLSEDKWFTGMLGIDVAAPPLPTEETRLAFIRRYAEDSAKRHARLVDKDVEWWEEDVAFFDTHHNRAWIIVRRIAHTAHHRAEQTTLLRLLGRQVWSVYGPAVDTGGLPANDARTIYAYPTVDALITGESRGGAKAPLPGPGPHPSTERPK